MLVALHCPLQLGLRRSCGSPYPRTQPQSEHESPHPSPKPPPQRSLLLRPVACCLPEAQRSVGAHRPRSSRQQLARLAMGRGHAHDAGVHPAACSHPHPHPHRQQAHWVHSAHCVRLASLSHSHRLARRVCALCPRLRVRCQQMLRHHSHAPTPRTRRYSLRQCMPWCDQCAVVQRGG